MKDRQGQGLFPSLLQVDTGSGLVSATGAEVAKAIVQSVKDCVRVR